MISQAAGGALLGNHVPLRKHQSGLLYALRDGSKSEGFFPGLPIEDGIYLGFGVLGGW